MKNQMKSLTKLIAGVAIGSMLFTSCSKEPTASISADKTNVGIDESIKFSNSSTDAASYKWDFGDGTSSIDKEPSKVYTKAGTYNVKMTAYSKKEKKSDEASVSITVNEAVLTATPTSQSATTAAGSFVIAVSSNTSWTAASNQSWATVSPASGTKDGSVTVNYTENTGSARSATITLTAKDVTPVMVTLSQAGVSTGGGGTQTKTEMLSGKNWKLSAFTVDPALDWDGTGTAVNNLYSQLQACEKDNISKFSTNGSLIYDEGTTMCSTTDIQTMNGTWSFNIDETKITVSVPDFATATNEFMSWDVNYEYTPRTWDIVSLTSTELKVTIVEQDANGTNYTYTLTYTN